MFNSNLEMKSVNLSSDLFPSNRGFKLCWQALFHVKVYRYIVATTTQRLRLWITLEMTTYFNYHFLYSNIFKMLLICGFVKYTFRSHEQSFQPLQNGIIYVLLIIFSFTNKSGTKYSILWIIVNIFPLFLNLYLHVVDQTVHNFGQTIIGLKMIKTRMIQVVCFIVPQRKYR